MLTGRVTAWCGVMVLVVSAVLASGPGNATERRPIERPVGSVVITGALEDRVFLTFEQVEGLPLNQQSVSVTFQSGQTQEKHIFTGFLLYDVLTFLKPQFDPDVKNEKLRFYVSATGTDDY